VITNSRKRRALKEAAKKRRMRLEEQRIKDVNCFHDNYNVGSDNYCPDTQKNIWSKYYYKPICNMYDIQEYKNEKRRNFNVTILCILIILNTLYMRLFKFKL
jgi:hypothetical protein